MFYSFCSAPPVELRTPGMHATVCKCAPGRSDGVTLDRGCPYITPLDLHTSHVTPLTLHLTPHTSRLTNHHSHLRHWPHTSLLLLRNAAVIFCVSCGIDFLSCCIWPMAQRLKPPCATRIFIDQITKILRSTYHECMCASVS